MNQEKSVEYADTGHEAILESIRQKFELDFINTFKTRHTACGLASMKHNEKVFIKVKGYVKNKRNQGRFRRAVNSNRMAAKIKSDIIPRLIEFRAFERANVYWLTSLSAYGGEPISQGLFFSGDESIINHSIIERLRDSVEIIQKAPTVSLCYTPLEVANQISKVFGRSVTAAASEWTSHGIIFNGLVSKSTGCRVGSLWCWAAERSRLRRWQRLWPTWGQLYAGLCHGLRQAALTQRP